MTMQQLLNILHDIRKDTPRRPWDHFSKTGPGRKHQQGQSKTKEQRNGR